MHIPLILFSSIAAVVVSTGGKSAQDCTIGDQWTENFIRFECYQGTGLVVKGVRAIGCVPTNTAAGAMIQTGTTFDEQYFTYSCTKNGDVVAYQIINCRDTTGKNLAVDETRQMDDGSTLKCYKEKSGAIKMSQDTAGGCLHDGKKYTVGKTWIQNLDFKATVAGAVQSIGKGVVMQCNSAGATGFVAQATGCVTMAGTNLANGGFAVVNSLYVKCMIASTGTVTMSVVDESDVTCTINGTTVKGGEKYTSPDGQDVYYCSYGTIKKSGCVIDGKTYGSGYVLSNGKSYHCNSGAGVVDFGSLTGCTLSDGSLKPFMSTYINRTEVQRCVYSIKASIITPYAEFWGCSYGTRAIGKNKIASNGDELKKCAAVGSFYAMRDLTTAEHTAYIQSQSVGGSSNVIGGSGGSGSGGDVTADPTTTTTTITTTTKPSTTTSTRAHTTTTTPVTTTERPVTTTTAQKVKITTQEDTTRAPATTAVKEIEITAPAELTTTAVESASATTTTPITTTRRPTTTTTTEKDEIITQEDTTAALVPSTTGVPLPSPSTGSPVTAGPTTVVPGQCHDLFDMCSTLAPICTNHHNSSVSNLKEIMKTMNVTVEQIKEIFNLMGVDKPRTSSEEEKEEMDEVIRGLTGFESEEEQDCGCRDDPCVSRCQRRRKPSCKKCQIFKRKVYELVIMVCPATCGSCDTVGKVPAIIKALVRFYTHDCR